MGAAASAAPVRSTAAARAATGLTAVPIGAPRVPGSITAHRTASTDCVLPDGTTVSFFHCYTPCPEFRSRAALWAVGGFRAVVNCDAQIRALCAGVAFICMRRV
jgi:hypothetical protein